MIVENDVLMQHRRHAILAIESQGKRKSFRILILLQCSFAFLGEGARKRLLDHIDHKFAERLPHCVIANQHVDMPIATLEVTADQRWNSTVADNQSAANEPTTIVGVTRQVHRAVFVTLVLMYEGNACFRHRLFTREMKSCRPRAAVTGHTKTIFEYRSIESTTYRVLERIATAVLGAMASLPGRQEPLE